MHYCILVALEIHQIIIIIIIIIKLNGGVMNSIMKN